MKKLMIFTLVTSVLVFCTGCSNESYLSQQENDAQTSNEEIASDSAQFSDKIYVQVAGAVLKPGVYELDGNSRVYQAIEAAGGLCDDANDSDINQAKTLEDGEKIVVLTNAERLELEQSKETSSLINLNSATKEQLMTLPGIGESKANAIISYRESKGKFQSVDDLKNISGIKDGVFNKIKDSVTV